MLFLLMCLLATATLVIGFFVGRSAKKDPDALSRRERKLLEDLTIMRLDLIEIAAEGATLGDDTAVRVLGRLNRKEIAS